MRIVVLLLLTVALAAQEEPRKLNPSDPAEAIQIVDRITLHATWPGMDREQAVTLQIALETLNAVVAARKATPPPEEKPPEKPAEKAAEKPVAEAKPDAPKEHAP